ncbi:MAG TPA: MBL fold metallo-hydrolase [Acidimicrobiales bacterium]|nr:MBL fold metallo-hydrolase [Acidimicrobiales bacterium]
MHTTLDEINDGIYRISTFVPEVSPEGFTFNQFLIDAEQPLLFHTGARGMFPLVAEQVAKVLPPESLRWITFGHVESDECGAMNMWLATAPQSQVVFNGLGCDVSLNDLCDRPPRAVADDEVLDLGGKRVRFLTTPHVPHGWEAQVIFEESTGTLFSGDLLSHIGDGPAVTSVDVTSAAITAEAIFHSTALNPATGATIRRLADLSPSTLAIMHGSSYAGDGGAVLRNLASAYDDLVADAAEAGALV